VNLSLDAGMAVKLLRGDGPEVRDRFRAALENGTVWISSIVVHDLVAGALASRRPVEHLEQVDRLVERLQVAEFNCDDAFAAARLRADLEGQGRGIDALETLVAGQALARDWIVATSNLAAFLRVDGLKVIDWTRSDQPIDRADMLARVMRQGPAELTQLLRREKEAK
jgi:tRNA(fMet)-specific endonuclease VapC